MHKAEDFERKYREVRKRKAEETIALVKEAVEAGINICLICRTQADHSLAERSFQTTGPVPKGRGAIYYGTSRSSDKDVFFVEVADVTF